MVASLLRARRGRTRWVSSADRAGGVADALEGAVEAADKTCTLFGIVRKDVAVVEDAAHPVIHVVAVEDPALDVLLRDAAGLEVFERIERQRLLRVRANPGGEVFREHVNGLAPAFRFHGSSRSRQFSNRGNSTANGFWAFANGIVGWGGDAR